MNEQSKADGQSLQARAEALRVAEKIAQTCRSWGVDESKVRYDLPMGEAWLITHLHDMVASLQASVEAKEQRNEALVSDLADAWHRRDIAAKQREEVEAKLSAAEEARETAVKLVAGYKQDSDFLDELETEHGDIRSGARTWSELRAKLSAAEGELRKLKSMALCAGCNVIREVVLDSEIVATITYDFKAGETRITPVKSDGDVDEP
jgi:hypothetical protein